MKPPASLAVLASIIGLACASPTPPAPQTKPDEHPVIVGETTRERVEAAPEWAVAEAESRPDPEASRALASVPPGAEVTIFLGTWCGDSRREVPRLWKALDLAGPAVPFEIHYIGVDHGKQEPGGRVPGNDVRYVPTFIVRRNGQEVGRIVEQSPGGVEKDLLALLTGRTHGLITARTDLGAPGSSSH